MNIYINKEEIEAINYALDRISGYISDDEEVNAANEKASDTLLSLVRKINKNKKKH